MTHADFRHQPQIVDVDLASYTGQPGEVIHVQAVDDFEVVSVCMTLTLLDGTLVEHGAALPGQNPGAWRYVTQAAAASGQTLVVHVTASDRPENFVTKTYSWAVWACSRWSSS